MIKINFVKTFVGAFTLAFKNIPSIFGCAILWLLTFWIPYINVGTSIAMANLPIALSQGKVINPLSIFSSVYRKKMGDYIIFNFLAYGAIFIACFYFIIPGIVLMIAWSMAKFIMIEKDKSPLEALRLSNNITNGNKWMIVAIKLATNFAMIILALIILSILTAIEWPTLDIIVCFILLVSYIGLGKSVDAMLWQQLKKSEMLD